MDDLEKKVAGENLESSDSGNNYEFVTETIKRRPVNKRKVLKKIFFTIFLAILFGTVATVTLLVLYPRLYKEIYPSDDTKHVTVPVIAEEINEDPVEEFVVPEGDVDESTVDNSIDREQGTELPSDEENQIATEDDSKAPAHDESEGVVINQVVETVEKELEPDDYRALLRKIGAITTTVEKSLVTVSGRSQDVDWFNNSYENNTSSTGVIVADNGRELLIVAPSDIVSNASYVDVTFCDGAIARASVRSSDANTGLCVIAVLLSNIDENTLGHIETGHFGGIAASSVGAPVVAVGSIYGTVGSSSIGQITSSSAVIDKIDSNVTIISTDIYASDNASGVIVNFSGRIVGIVCHERAFSDMPNLIYAYSASDITKTIEKMSNGQSIACLGIYGTDVTRQAKEELGVPEGAYVKEVVVDSPAMNEGIRNGDVIQKIGNREITSFSDYKNAILECVPGDIVKVSLMRPGGEEYVEIEYEVTLEALK